MDTTKTITHLGLCAGYGGIELGLKRVLPAMRTVALCEIEAFACANLVAKMEAGLMDPAPIWTDLKTFPWDSFRDRVDILTGGYPCQPFSTAGKRAGTDDPRHLWPFIADGIKRMAPRLCFFENVEGHITLGLREVIAELEELGYETAWGIFSASEVGAPHQRKRVFILAYRIDQGSQGWLRGWQDTGREDQHGHAGCCSAGVHRWWPSRPGQPQHAWEPPRVVGDAESGMPRKSSAWHWRKSAGGAGEADSMGNAESGDGQRSAQGEAGHAAQPDQDAGCGQTKCTLGRNTNESSSGLDYAKLYTSCDNRTDELRLLGNGVVPATAEKAFLTLINEIQKTSSSTSQLG